jgi:hypothetical protein
MSDATDPDDGMAHIWDYFHRRDGRPDGAGALAGEARPANPSH